ncbi:MAG: winged helix-turn-helix transcriptional regulator [Solirubrobacteraceae bacterium]|nr:winged helix-turn-helix transcriptional regulator [Solirubrobacteraceae bacterium]
MTTHPDPRFQAAADTPAGQLARQLYGLASVRRELGKVANAELPGHGFGALVSVRKREHARVSDIAADLQVDLSVASRQIAGLVAAGLVERQPDPADGRAHVLALTDAGITALRAAFLEMVARLDQSLADWAPEEITQLAAGLERLATSFNAVAATSADADADTDSADQEVAA